MPITQFGDLFRTATGGHDPHPWQEQLALADPQPELVRAPTGAGKTEAVVLSWLWRRRYADPANQAQTARRLVYCLPMRVLVEQTADRIAAMLERLGIADHVGVHILMGGEAATDWSAYPERDAVLVGTLDQLLSRALMRGYGVSRFAAPVHFGLLHNDAEWIIDEVQLFGEALATTTQLDGLRAALPAGVLPARTLWMSATVEPSWVTSVDRPPPAADRVLELGEADRTGSLGIRLAATKPLRKVAQITAQVVAEAHRPGTLTLVVLNRVAEARDLYRDLVKKKSPVDPAIVVLLHSRFRPADRAAALGRALAEPGPEGRIVVSTQVVEAGVDMDATTLITQTAPWASLVQRFGRCNRRGQSNAEAQVIWAPMVAEDRALTAKSTAPYDPDQIAHATDALTRLGGDSVGPNDLDRHGIAIQAPVSRHVLRRRDLLGLFDTAPDLAGLDVDIQRFVRDADEITAGVAWRPLGAASPAEGDPAPGRAELCPVPLSELRAAMEKRDGSRLWRLDPVEGQWRSIGRFDIRPGDRLVADVRWGFYEPTIGFAPDPKLRAEVDPVVSAGDGPHSMAGDDHVAADPASQVAGTITLAQHTDGVCEQLAALLERIDGLDDRERAALQRAARLHDWGKAHEVFQDVMTAGVEGIDRSRLWAKRGRGAPRYSRPGFRHELASALAIRAVADEDSLVTYLVAAHHGKVRLGARALPDEGLVVDSVLGCRDGDVLPEADLGGGVTMPAAVLSLDPLNLGTLDGKPTYTDDALGLLDQLGPFRLAYLEVLLRTADTRRSALEGQATATEGASDA